jgi:anti-sigma factor RsiW
MNFNKLDLKLQAYLDGELSEKEARQIERDLANDSGQRELLAELRMTSAALKGLEGAIKVPESREFYWSKIERAIASQEVHQPVREKTSIAETLRRFLVPAAGFAVLAIACILGLSQSGVFNSPLAFEGESAVADPGAMTYRDFSTKTTLVWLSYPAEKEFADDEEASTL